MREFAYQGEIKMSEDEVKRAVAAVLRRQGWQANVKWRHEPGIDIEALRGKERMVIEAKGEGSLAPMRANYFLMTLGELLQRMDSQDASYNIALPAHRQFVGLIFRLPVFIRRLLRIGFFLVKPSGQDSFEIAFVPPETDLSKAR